MPDTKSAHLLTQQLKSDLRRDKKRARRNLTHSQQQLAANSLCRLVTSSLPYLRARRVAIYWPWAGEISPLPLLNQLSQTLKKEWYLPVVQDSAMQFYRVDARQRLIANRFGIPEPDTKGLAPIKPWLLDLVVVPLVAFDGQRNRLGMGGGFYDRCFSRDHRLIKKPFLLGVAHQCQAADKIPVEPWDITLDAVATDKHWI